MTDAEVLIPAATVVLLRDRQDGVETLMLKRNSTIAFGGAWVFPGGRVDDADRLMAAKVLGSDDEFFAAQAAAEREAEEETGLEIDVSLMVGWSYWVPPMAASMETTAKGPRRRFSTWFFVAPAPAGDVSVDGGEIHEHRWLSPAESLDLQAAGEIELVPPTWVTLKQLSEFGSVADALAAANERSNMEFKTQPLGSKPPTLVWKGDAEHSDTEDSGTGGVHRLTLDKAGWIYRASF